jgi:hypothetical protein
MGEMAISTVNHGMRFYHGGYCYERGQPGLFLTTWKTIKQSESKGRKKTMQTND